MYLYRLRVRRVLPVAVQDDLRRASDGGYR